MRRLRDWFDLALARDDAHRYAVERDAARRMTEHCRQQRDVWRRRFEFLLASHEQSQAEADAYADRLRLLSDKLHDPSLHPMQVLEAAEKANGGRLVWREAKDWVEPKGETGG